MDKRKQVGGQKAGGSRSYSRNTRQNRITSGNTRQNRITSADKCIVREQDRFMPTANVIRIMRRVIPDDAIISDDAKAAILEYVSKFISFVTREANLRCHEDQRKTITAEDLIWGMSNLGLEDYLEPLAIYLKRFRENGEHPWSDGQPQSTLSIEHGAMGVTNAFTPTMGITNAFTPAVAPEMSITNAFLPAITPTMDFTNAFRPVMNITNAFTPPITPTMNFTNAFTPAMNIANVFTPAITPVMGFTNAFTPEMGITNVFTPAYYMGPWLPGVMTMEDFLKYAQNAHAGSTSGSGGSTSGSGSGGGGAAGVNSAP